MTKGASIIIFIIIFNLAFPLHFYLNHRDKALQPVVKMIDNQEYEEAVIALDHFTEDALLINVDADYYYSMCYNRLELYELAAKYCGYYSVFKDDVKGKYEKAISDYGLGNYEAAIAAFKAVEAEYSDNSEYLNFYGNACYFFGDFETAMKSLEKAAQLRPETEYLSYYLYYCYYEMKAYSRGIEQINREFSRLNEEDEYYQFDREELFYYRADFAFLDGRYDQALADYRLLVEEETYYMDEAYYLIAKCYVKLYDYESAYHALAAGLEYDPYYYQIYRYDEAFTDFYNDEVYGPMVDQLEGAAAEYY